MKNQKNFNKIVIFLIILVSTFAIGNISFIAHAEEINPPVAFDGIGNEKLRECPTFDCKVIKYGGYLPRIELIESSGEWYRVNYIERSSEYANRNNSINAPSVELPKSQWKTTTGYLYYTLIPESILSQVGDTSIVKKDVLIGTATLKTQSVVLNCPSKNNCTILTYVDMGTSLQIVGIDKTGLWYKVMIDNPFLVGWDKWIQANNFTDESRNLISKNQISASSTSPEIQSSPLGITNWFKNIFDKIHLPVNGVLSVLGILILITIFYTIGKYRIFSKISFTWIKSHKTIGIGASAICLVLVLFFVYNFYEKRETELKNFLTSQQKTLQDTQKNLDDLNQKYTKESNQRIVQEKTAREVIARLENKIDNNSASKTKDIASVINQWSGIIGKIECDFVENQETWISQGSGTTLGLNGQTVVLSNRHVLVPNNITPNVCRTKLLNSSSVYSGNDIRVSSSGQDWAVLYLNNLDSQIKSITARQPVICKNKPSVGDGVVILGYPTVGSKTGITATEGIIAGYDEDFFITSAKVEHGNSGGAAILLKDNCLLGIPTFAETGTIESLARILDIQAVLR